MYIFIVFFLISCGINQEEVITGPGTTTTSFGSIQGELTSNQGQSKTTRVQLFQEEDLRFNKIKEIYPDSNSVYKFDSLELGRYLLFAYSQNEIQNTSILEVSSSNLVLNESIQLQPYQKISFPKPQDLEAFYSIDTREAQLDLDGNINTYVLKGQTRVWAKFKNKEIKQYSIGTKADTLIMKSDQEPSEVLKFLFQSSYGTYTP